MTTEKERLARLHKRAGCFDAEENDQFDGIAYGLCPARHAPASVCEICDNMENALRAAVEAERERTLQEMVEGITVEHGHCSVCDRVVAAIRARGERE